MLWVELPLCFVTCKWLAFSFFGGINTTTELIKRSIASFPGSNDCREVESFPSKLMKGAQDVANALAEVLNEQN